MTATRGYATEDREHHPDTRALAAPVRDYNGHAIAAVASTAPAAQLPPDAIREIAGAVTRRASSISHELGALSPS